MFRKVISVVIGLVVAVIIFLLAEKFATSLYPFEIKQQSGSTVNKGQPTLFWLIVWAGWVLGSFSCGIIIKWISQLQSKQLPIIAGSILTLSAVLNFFSFPHPIWLIIITIPVFLLSVNLGHYIINLK